MPDEFHTIQHQTGVILRLLADQLGHSFTDWGQVQELAKTVHVSFWEKYLQDRVLYAGAARKEQVHIFRTILEQFFQQLQELETE